MVISKKETDFVNDVLEEYNSIYNEIGFVDEAFLEKYRDFINKLRSAERNNIVDFSEYEIIKPNTMQVKAMENLNILRKSGENKALVISATGTGKTYMSAFNF